MMHKFWLLAALWLLIAGIALNSVESRRDEYEGEIADTRYHKESSRWESEEERKGFFENIRDKAADIGRATFRQLRGSRPYDDRVRPEPVSVQGRKWREWASPNKNAGGPEHSMRDAVKATAYDAKEAVKDTAGELKDTAVETGYVLKEDLKDVKDSAKEHGRVLREDARDIKDAAAEKVDRFATGVRDRARDAAGSVREGLHEMHRTARDTGYRLKEAAADVKDAAVDMKDRTKEKLEGWAESAADAARAAGYKVNEAATDVKEAAKETVNRWSGRIEDVKDATVEKARDLKDAAAETVYDAKDKVESKYEEVKDRAAEQVHEADYKAESRYQKMKDCLCAGKNLVVDKITGIKRCLCDAFGGVSARRENEEVFEPAAEGIAEHNIKEDIGHVRETLPLDELTHAPNDVQVVTLKSFQSTPAYAESHLPFKFADLVQTEVPSMWTPRKQFHVPEAAEIKTVTFTEREVKPESILNPTAEDLRANHPTTFIDRDAKSESSILEPTAEDYRAMHPAEHSRQHIGLTQVIRDFKTKVQEKFRHYKDKLAHPFRRTKEGTATDEKMWEPANFVPEEGKAYSYYDATKLEHHPLSFELFAVSYKRGADLYEEARKKIGEMEEPHATPDMRNDLAHQAIVLFKESLAAVEEAEAMMVKRLEHLRRMTKQEYDATRAVGDIAYEGAITRAEDELEHARKLIATLFEQLDRDFPPDKY